MIISIITLFPEMFAGVFDHSITKRARAQGKITIEYINLRDFGIGRHRTVDDTPYGGGAGMVLKVDVLHKAILHARKNIEGEKVILLDPAGTPYTQAYAESFSKLEHIILICGHYEGFDARVKAFIDMELSIGDYVLSGGEVASMVVVESIMRLREGVLKKENATSLESFSESENGRILEFPQYTRPVEYEGMKVPNVLLSGNQKFIEDYRKQEALTLTSQKRPDILSKK